MADILIANEVAPSTPASGNSIIYVDSTTKLLSSINDKGTIATNPLWLRNQSVATQTGVSNFSSDSYLTGSNITFPNGVPRVGTRYRCTFDMTKTGAGTATPILTVRIGTNGSTADAAICAMTYGAGTAAADTGLFYIDAIFRTVGASTSAVLQAITELTNNLTTTGLSNAVKSVLTTSSGFDSTPAGSIIGVSFNGGASFSGTCVLVDAELTAL